MAPSDGAVPARARALACVAATVAPEDGRRLLAEAFRLGQWTAPLQALAHVDTELLLTLADETQAG